MNTLSKPVATMSSIDLVDLINSMREEGSAELLHKNFLVKIEKHPGITSAKFLAYVEIDIGNGATRKSKCYYLPKRECELMVMSESLEVQTKVYDRMTALEQQLIQQPTAKPSLVQPAKEFRAMYGIARLIGLDKHVAAISANQAVAKTTGANFLELLGHTHLEAEKQEIYYTPTALGAQIGASAMRFNALLSIAGLQEKRGTHWEVLPEGKKYARILDTGKKHGNGTMVQQIKWSNATLDIVNGLQDKLAA